MIPSWVRLEKFLNYLLVFLLPTQLALHFWPPSAFVFGIRVDYLAPSIYLTDVLFLTLFAIWIRNQQKRFLDFIDKNKIYILLFIFLASVNIAFSTSLFASAYKWLKLIELVIFAYYVHARGDIFKSKTLFVTLFYSLVFFSAIGICQFILGRTLGGPLYLLGERSFTASTPGIALVDIFGRSFIRAYSTFSHPNSFAGYLGIGLMTAFFAFSKKELIKKSPGMVLIFIAFVLTFSLSAFIGIILCLVLFFLIRIKFLSPKKIIYIPGVFLLISLTLPLASRVLIQSRLNLPQNINQRIELSFGAGTMISRNFLLGTGLNTFIINEPKIKYLSSYLWTLQPVHNIFLLVFSETGVFGILFVYLLMIRSTQKTVLLRNKTFYLALVFVLATGLADHYWFTLQQNMFLLAFVFSNSFRE